MNGPALTGQTAGADAVLPRRQGLRLGLFHPSARAIHVHSPMVAARNPDPFHLPTQVAVAHACEEAGLDFLFLADAWGSYGPRCTAMGLQDPIALAPVLAAALMSTTTRLRFITTLHTSWFSPLQIARLGATLDALSGGRWGMNVVSGTGFADLLVTGDETISHDERYERANEAMAIVLQAWSGELIDHQGTHYRINGPLVGPTPVQQPHPLIVSAGASAAGIRFAGRYADVIFMPGRTPDADRAARVEAVRRAAEESGRPPADIRVQMHVSVLVRETAQEAENLSRAIQASVDARAVAEYLASVRANVSTYDDIYREMGELPLQEIGLVSGARKIHGGPDDVADALARLYESGCDSVAVALPFWSPEEIHDFARLVLPRLAERGAWTHPADHAPGW